MDFIPKDQPGRLWSTLKELCGGLSAAQIQRWAKRFWSLRKLPQESVALFTGRFQNLVTDLAEAGRKIPEYDLQTQYLDALGPEYQALVDSVLLNAVPTTLNRIQGLALEYELRIIRGKLHRAAKNGNEDDDQNNYALSVAGSTPSKAKHRKETNHRSSSESDATGSLCGHCGKTNHLTENCITHLKEQIN